MHKTLFFDWAKYVYPVRKRLDTFPPIDLIGQNPKKCRECGSWLSENSSDQMILDGDSIRIHTATVCGICEAVLGPDKFRITFCRRCGIPLEPHGEYPFPNFFKFNMYDHNYYCQECFNVVAADIINGTVKYLDDDGKVKVKKYGE